MTDSDTLRYARQIRLPEVGLDGQRRLAQRSALVIGAGGLGAPALHHLVASGVGRVGFVEFDSVDLSNLHRQTLYATPDVGRPKSDAALDRLRAVNPDVTVEAHSTRLDTSNADELIARYDVVLDGSDTFGTRYLVNDASVRTGTPNVFASVSQFAGQASMFGVPGGPCYRCLFPDPPPPDLIPNCADGGVLGVVPSILGGIQAAEALKWLLGIGDSLVGRLLMLDVLRMDVREIAVERDPACPACGDHRRAIPAPPAGPAEITVAELRAGLARGPVRLLDVREASERADGDLEAPLIPLGHLEARAFELDDARGHELVVFCASGGRSAQAVRLLRDRGVEARSLRGGMTAWRAST